MVEGVKGLATPFLSAVALPPRIGCIEPLGGPSVCRRANFGMLARPHFVLRCLRSDGVSRAIGMKLSPVGVKNRTANSMFNPTLIVIEAFIR